MSEESVEFLSKLLINTFAAIYGECDSRAFPAQHITANITLSGKSMLHRRIAMKGISQFNGGNVKIKVNYAALESAQLCKAKNDVRKYICGVAFMNGGRVAATNGHILFVCDGAHDGKFKETIILSVQKKPLTRYDHAIIDTRSSYINYYDKDGKMTGVGLVEIVDGKYPDIDRLIKGFSPSPCDKVGFNASYLEVIGKISKFFNPKWSSVAIQLNGSLNGALSEIGGSLGKAKLIVMPMRID